MNPEHIAIAGASLLVVILLLDHYRKHGNLYDVHDVDNHETLIIALIGFAIGIALTTFI